MEPFKFLKFLPNMKCSRLFLFFMFFSIFAYSEIIKSIEIIGNKKIESDSIKYRLTSKVGEEFNPSNVKKDIRALYAQGFYSDISVKKEPLNGGVLLRYLITEKPIIGKISYKGHSAVDLSDLEAENDVKVYSIINRPALNKVLRKISALYEKKGYYLADINYSVSEPINNDVTVTFNIQEHQKVLIKKIILLGNKNFSDEKLKSIMAQTQEGEISSWLTSRGTFNETALKIDIERIMYFYRTHGYMQIQTSPPAVVLSPDKKFIYITIHITEGVPFNIGTIDISGDFLPSESKEKLQTLLKLQNGAIFNREFLSQDIYSIQQVYEDYGYAFANVIPKTRVIEEKRLIDVVLDIDKGELVHFGKIFIKGNNRTRDKVIRRELKLNEGELYSGSNLRKSRDNVNRLGYFSEVNVTTPHSKQQQNVLDIEITVKERQTGQIQVGAGYSSYEKFMGTAQLSESNFLGYGQTVSLKGELAKARHEITASFEEPYLFDTNWLGGLSFSYQGQKYEDYEQKKISSSITLGYPIGEFTKFFGSTRIEYVFTDDPGFDESTFVFPPPNDNNRFYLMKSDLLYSIKTSIAKDLRDNRFDPSKGYYTSASYEYNFGSFLYHEVSLGGQYYHPLIWNLISRTRLQYGYMHPQSDKGIPVNYRYKLGGMFSIRGFDTHSLGPKTTVKRRIEKNKTITYEDYLYTYGGVHRILFNQEIQFDLIKEAGLKGVIFFDAGNTFDEYDSMVDKLFKKAGPNKGIHMSIGWGFRWFSPLGPLRFEFGSSLPLKDSLISARKFEFMIGQFF